MSLNNMFLPLYIMRVNIYKNYTSNNIIYFMGNSFLTSVSIEIHTRYYHNKSEDNILKNINRIHLNDSSLSESIERKINKR